MEPLAKPEWFGITFLIHYISQSPHINPYTYERLVRDLDVLGIPPPQKGSIKLLEDHVVELGWKCNNVYELNKYSALKAHAVRVCARDNTASSQQVQCKMAEIGVSFIDFVDIPPSETTASRSKPLFRRLADPSKQAAARTTENFTPLAEEPPRKRPRTSPVPGIANHGHAGILPASRIAVNSMMTHSTGMASGIFNLLDVSTDRNALYAELCRARKERDVLHHVVAEWSNNARQQQEAAARHLEKANGLETQVKALRSAQESSKSEHKEALEKASQESAMWQRRVDKLLSELVSAREEQERAEKELTAATATHATANKEHLRTMQSLTVAKDEACEVKAQLQTLIANYTTIEADLRTALEERDLMDQRRAAAFIEASGLLESEGRGWFMERSTLRRKLTAAQEALAAREQEHQGALRNSQSEAETAVAGRMEERSTWTAQADALRADLEREKDERQRAVALHDKIARDLVDAKRTIAGAQADASSDQLAMVEEKLRTALLEMEVLRALEPKLMHSQALLDQANDKVAFGEETRSALEHKLAQAEASLASDRLLLTSKTTSLQCELHAQQEQLAQARVTHISMQDACRQAAAHLADADAKQSALQQQLQHTERAWEEATATQERLQAALVGVAAQRDDHETHVIMLQGELRLHTDYGTECISLRQRLDATEVARREAVTEAEALQDTLTDVIQERNEHQARSAELIGELKAREGYKADLATLKRYLEDSERARDDLARACETLQASFDAAAHERDEQRATIMALTDTLNGAPTQAEYNHLRLGFTDAESSRERSEAAQKTLQDALNKTTTEQDEQQGEIQKLQSTLAAHPLAGISAQRADDRDKSAVLDGTFGTTTANPHKTKQPASVADALKNLDDLLACQYKEDGVSRGLREAMEVLARQRR